MGSKIIAYAKPKRWKSGIRLEGEVPAVSEKQRKMMAIAEHEPGKLYRRNRGVLSMSKEDLSDFARKRKRKTVLTGRR